MIEIFENIPDSVKETSQQVFDLALLLKNPQAIASFLNEYTNSCQNEEEQEFIRFYFNMRMAQLINENPDDQR